MCLNIGTPKNINFPFETNGKLMILGVPILKHFRVNWRKVIASFQNFSNKNLDLGLLAIPRQLFCFGSLVILDVKCRYLSLVLLYINTEIGKNRC